MDHISDDILYQYTYRNVIKTIVTISDDYESNYNKYDMHCGICEKNIPQIKHYCDQCLECFCTKYHARSHNRLFHNHFKRITRLNHLGRRLHIHLNERFEDMTDIYVKILDGVDASSIVYIVIEICKVCSTLTNNNSRPFSGTIMDGVLWAIKNRCEGSKYKGIYKVLKHKKKLINCVLEEYDSIRSMI